MYAGTLLAVIALSLPLPAIFRRGSDAWRLHLFYLEVSQRSVVFSLAVVIADDSVLSFALSTPSEPEYIYFERFFQRPVPQRCRPVPHRQFDACSITTTHVDWAEGDFYVACLIVMGLSAEAGALAKLARVTFSSPGEDHLLEQLASLNQLLGRTVRR